MDFKNTVKKRDGVLNIPNNTYLEAALCLATKKVKEMKAQISHFSTVCSQEIEKKGTLLTQKTNYTHGIDYSAFQQKVPAPPLTSPVSYFLIHQTETPNRNSYKNTMREEVKQETVNRTSPTNGVKGKPEQPT